MSRHLPISLRHKHRPAPVQATPQNLSVIVLRLGAVLCWLGGFVLLVLAMLSVSQVQRTVLATWLWGPVGFAALGGAALVVGSRLWTLHRWACAAAIVTTWLLCFVEPWRPENYTGREIDITAALGGNLAACVIFAAPLTIAWFVARAKLRSGF